MPVQKGAMDPAGQHGIDDSVVRILKKLTRRLRHLEPLRHGEVSAVALRNPKTAALFYDRVWGALDSTMPQDIAFWGASEPETIALFAAGSLIADRARNGEFGGSLPEPDVVGVEGTDDISQFVRSIAEGASAKQVRPVVPVYSSREQRDIEYKLGDRAAVIASIEGLEIVSEAHLTWPQVQRKYAVTAMLR